MYLIFMDESGDASFPEKPNSKYFLITCLTIYDSLNQKMKRIMQSKKAKLYRLGWPKNIEIKAYLLHKLNCNLSFRKKIGISIDGDESIKEVLTSIKNSYNPKIDYFAVNKARIKSKSLRSAEYGIAYNFFARKILCPLIIKAQNCRLIVDQRSKETHSKRHFNDYIKTEVIAEAVDRNIEVELKIQHFESHKALGLQSVDFFSWSLHRLIVYKDAQFYDIFKDLIGEYQRWYC